MHRRAAALALALLVAVPLTPAAAADPSASPAPAPTATPAVDPTATPTASPIVEPSDAPPSASPAVDPSLVPSVDPSPSDDPSVAPPDEPSAAPSATPGKNSATPGAGKANGGLDATNRWIVVLRGSSDVAAVKDRAQRGPGVATDRTFTRSVRGFSATMSAAQAKALRADPDVAAVVPDEIITVTAQYTPLGVRRIGGLRSSVAAIDGTDARVDADVAIVDTGIDPTHPDLNVAGGYNCSTADRSLWRDVENHGTHVAGTVGAKDNGSGVVGVAPGVRLWAVKILNDEGYGYLSWYVCGLDWITAQRDAADPTRPLFEAVNMSVAKPGRDDKACGSTDADILHAAICRLVASGVTVVAAAGNDTSTASTLVPAAYDEVITVSALADTDGRAGGLGGSLCYSWGTYDRDDTLADFSNYGWDVDIIAPGKCIWSTLPGDRYGYSSGTSMAAPHVTGAVALYKASRPYATPAEVKDALVALGTMDWDVTSDRDSYHEPLLDVSRIVPLGDYAIRPSATVTMPESGGTATFPVSLVRSEGFFEGVSLAVKATNGLAASLSTFNLVGATATEAQLTVSVPPATPPGTYNFVISGTNWNRVRTAVARITILYPRPPGPSRLAGADRFGTAAAISADTFASSAPVVYIANARNFPDALAGAAAAGAAHAPLLLVDRDAIPPTLAAELTRLKPDRIVILGGTGMVSNTTMSALGAYSGGKIRRLAGADRFGTAAAISADTFASSAPVVYIANARNFPDALAGAAAAGAAHAPLLLVDRDAIPPTLAAELTRLKPDRIVILGGTGMVSNTTMSALGAYSGGKIRRLAGADRFGTAAAISADTFASSAPVVYIANARNFPDALAGAAAAGAAHAPLLLVDRDAIPPTLAAELTRLKPGRIVILGGTGMVSNTTMSALGVR